MTDFTHDEENVTAILNGWWNQYFESPAAFMKTEKAKNCFENSTFIEHDRLGHTYSGNNRKYQSVL